MKVALLGPFSVTAAGRAVGPWPRPSARRLCQLVLVSPGRRVSRELACDELFPGLDPRAAARSVSKALSMARATLAGLGEPAAGLLAADLTHIWASPDAEVDAEQHERALRAALAMDPGAERDALLATALAAEGELLADEPYADWALRPRERLAVLRQEARLALARDRAKGAGQSRPAAVLAAWQACFEHDPASEEAAGALVRAYFAQGHRELAARVYERCRAAVAELGLGVSPWLEEAYATAAFEAVPAMGPPPPAAVPREELRTVSVLAAEVAASELDPERLRDVAGRALAAAIAEVEALGGTVTSVSGQGFQAMFGAPEAHEDDPERAARAAFRALSAVTAIGSALRIGVETGLAVLGPVGGGARVEYGAVGEVVGLAATLRSLAGPGSALVGPVTRAATEHLFTWGGTVPVAPQVTASRLDQPRPRARPRPGGLLAGRQAELAALDAALREAARGHGSVVLVTGEPGLGKTRLVQEGRRRAARGTQWLEGRCASYAASTPYGLYQQLLAAWAGVTPDQPAAVVGPALERALATVGGEDLFPPLARMMGLPPGAVLGRMGPAELHRATFAAWRSLVYRLVAAAPVVLVLEDLHWADPTSLRLTRDLAGLAAGRRLLVLATSRPEGAPELAAGPSAHRVALGPLPGADEAELARSLLGEAASREVLDAVLARADGNPLFLEERLTSLLETRALVRERGAWRITAVAGPAVPQALARLVRSRVDRLSSAARDAVRPASVLGPEFPLSLLTAVCAADEPLEPALAELCARDLLQEVTRSPEPVYRFRHALIQEATYEGLLRAERRRLHGRAAWALEAAAQGREAEVAAVLGQHFAAAGEATRALRYLEMAGDHATAAFANDEAVHSFRHGLAILGARPAAGPMADAAVEFQAKLANVLWRTGRRGEAREAFAAALRLADGGDPVRRAHLLIRLGRLEAFDRRYQAATAAFDAAEALLSPDDPAATEDWLELMVDGRVWQYASQHEPERALAVLTAVRPVLEASGSPARKHGFYLHLALTRVTQNGFRVDETDLANVRRSLAAAAAGEEEKDVGYATFFVGLLLWLHGDLAAAQEHLERALAMAERIGERTLLTQSLLGLALTALRRHDTEAVRALVPRVLAEADSMAGADFLAGAKACVAWLAWQDRHPAEVIKQSAEIAALLTTDADVGGYHGLVYLWPLVAVHLAAGHVAEAVAVGRRLPVYGQLLPRELAETLEPAFRAWDHGQPGPAADHLAVAVALARDLNYV